MTFISRVNTSYSAERIGTFKDEKDNIHVFHMFSLFDIYGNRISRAYVDLELMELEVKVEDWPTIIYPI